MTARRGAAGGRKPGKAFQRGVDEVQAAVKRAQMTPAEREEERQRELRAQAAERRQAQRVAQAAAERRRRELVGDLPPLTTPANMDARMARMAEIVGETPLATPGKVGGIGGSLRRRIEDARRRAALRSKDAG